MAQHPAAADGPDLPAEVILQRLERADTDDRCAVAARLWGLDALAARYRLVLAQTQVPTAQAGQHAPGAAAFRAFAAATLPIYDATDDDPDRPAELLPADR